jgi:predicted phage terminase large subunit-like protein
VRQKADSDKWMPLKRKLGSNEFEEGRGFYKAVGISGGLTGNALDFAIIDDPVKDAIEASSSTYQQRVWDWYVDVLSTRLHNESKQLLIMTRWNEADLAGKLLDKESEKWKIIKIPAVREDFDYKADPREIGEALWPKRHSLQKILDLKALNERTFTSLYQQRPAPEDGNIIPVKNIRHYHALPDDIKKYISWDMTFKDQKKSDFVAGHVWGVSGSNRYLIDRVKGRFDFVKTMDAFLALHNKHLDAVCTLVEDKANGPAIISMLRDIVPRIIPINPKDSKFARAQTASKSIESGNVYFPILSKEPWAKEVIEEMRVFPNGAHDDDVDTWSQFENYVFINQKKITHSRVKGIRI